MDEIFLHLRSVWVAVQFTVPACRYGSESSRAATGAHEAAERLLLAIEAFLAGAWCWGLPQDRESRLQSTATAVALLCRELRGAVEGSEPVVDLCGRLLRLLDQLDAEAYELAVAAGEDEPEQR